MASEPSLDVLQSRVASLAVRSKERAQEQLAANRRNFPEFAAFVDSYKAVFGAVRVRYLHDEATGYTVGRPGAIGVEINIVRRAEELTKKLTKGRR